MMLRGQGGGDDGRCLFTATQWQELEHQVLIFKYIVAGLQVPHVLVLPLRSRDGRLAIDTAPSLGWGYYGQYRRRAKNPELGRCRWTDATPSPLLSYHRYAPTQYCTFSLFPSGCSGYGSREHEDTEARWRQEQQHCLSLGADLSLHYYKNDL